MFVMVLIGSGIISLLGIAHAVFTFQSTPHGGPMMPTAPSVRAAMSEVGGLGIAPELRSTLWKAWIGFNYSHSLGVLVVGLLIGLPVALQGAIPSDHTGWLVGALLLPWTYLALSIRYWFSKPTQGIALAATLITVGIVGSLLVG